MKALGKAVVLLALLAAGVWVAGWGYWHFTIVGALASLERGVVPAPARMLPAYTLPAEPVEELNRAGGRALPYLVESLDSGRSPVFLAAVCDLLYRQDVLGPSAPPPITVDDGPADRASKCEAIRRAWQAAGAPAHQAWRWWSSRPLD